MRSATIKQLATVIAVASVLAAGSGHHAPGAADASFASDDGGAGADGSLPDAGRVPVNHRPTATACTPRTSVVPDGGFPDGGTCSYDSDCADGGPGTMNGRCMMNAVSQLASCSYDDCESDGNCADGGVCQCRDNLAAGTDICLTGNCRIDSDCGAGGYCSPMIGGCGLHLGTVAYYCHTPQDECLNDSNCNLPGLYCVFDATAKMHWICAPSDCSG